MRQKFFDPGQDLSSKSRREKRDVGFDRQNRLEPVFSMDFQKQVLNHALVFNNQPNDKSSRHISSAPRCPVLHRAANTACLARCENVSNISGNILLAASGFPLVSTKS